MGSAYFDAHSLWQLGDRPLFTALTEDLKVDVCVVGAGISGLTTAYLLAKAGQSVAVLDRERLGLGETGLTSAHLSNALDERFFELERLHGKEGARMAAESHTAAIQLIDQIQDQENIECDFQRVDGFLFMDEKTRPETWSRELNAAHMAGLTSVRLLEKAPLPLFDSGPCLQFRGQAQFHPMKYLAGLARAAEKYGARIFAHTEVVEVHGGAHAHVKTAQGLKVECKNVVVATNVPINNRVAIHTKNAAYRSYMIGVTVPSQMVRPALFWDTGDPYHYCRFVTHPHTGEDILLVGGEDHRTGQDANPEDHFNKLRRWVEERFQIFDAPVTRWSGQIMEPMDGLAYIGRNPGDSDNVFVITGDSGHGLTHGTLGGLLLRDLIMGRENHWATLYDPSRWHLNSLRTYMKEAVQSSAPYGDWLSEGDVASVDQIEPGEGAIVRQGLGKVAIYKDEMNRTHSFSAVCPHLGGLVRWNGAEKTWDCPCHGSRFDRFGQVINGPAVGELKPIDDTGGTAAETDILAT
ncbi:MAG TPA: FAD-dependent oxidoreductase [Bdellovibrionales bacterium]|nr:FAD-dependent oxidoreductase [Bdellovibrionales bacterium]